MKGHNQLRIMNYELRIKARRFCDERNAVIARGTFEERGCETKQSVNKCADVGNPRWSLRPNGLPHFVPPLPLRCYVRNDGNRAFQLFRPFKNNQITNH